MTKTRREFLQVMLALGASAGAVSLGACGDDDGGSSGTDAGGGGTDAGGGGTDAGGGGTDAGGGGTDAGGGGTDAGGGDTDAGGGETDAGGGDECTETSSTIAMNHGHTLMVPAADVAAGVEQTYNIQGASPHPHTVTITAADFTMLQAGMTIMVNSSRDSAHMHRVTVSCV